MRLFIVRHGESQSNADWHYAKKPADLNSHLTERGLQQSGKLAAWLKDNVPGIDLVYSSSLSRAQQTVQPIAEVFGKQVILDHRLREGGYNFSDGAPIPDDQLPMEKSVDFHAFPFEPFDSSVENCESYADLKERVSQFLDETVEAHSDKTVLVATHGWTINAFFDVIFSGCSFRQCYFQADNTSLSYFQHNPEWKFGPWYAHFVAQTPHLPFYPEGIKFE